MNTETTNVDLIHDIEQLHTKFGVREVVETFDREKLLAFLKFRLSFLQEELSEANSAFSELATPEQAGSAALHASEEIVDAMIDLCVVALGTLDALQVDSSLAWARVQAANMQKEPGVKASRPNPLGLPDLIKPAGWTAPSHLDNIGILSKIASH